MDDIEKILTLVDVELQKNGVFAIKVKDGNIFFFTKEFIKIMMDKIETNESERIMIFVKAGDEVGKVEMN